MWLLCIQQLMYSTIFILYAEFPCCIPQIFSSRNQATGLPVWLLQDNTCSRFAYHIPHLSESNFQLWLTHRPIWLQHLTISLLYPKFGYCAPNLVVLRHSLAALSRTFTLYPAVCAVYPTILPLHLAFSLPSPAFQLLFPQFGYCVPHFCSCTPNFAAVPALRVRYSAFPPLYPAI